jgi:hypothetical protein
VTTPAARPAIANPLSTQPTGVMDEHRIAPRRRVLKAGSIAFGGGTIDCTVRSISDTGPPSMWSLRFSSRTASH